MILLKSNAHSFYWLGRYLARIQLLCVQMPFQQDQAAQFALAFGLPVDEAVALNECLLDPSQACSIVQHFQQLQANIQDLRGVLSGAAYAELNRLIRMVHHQTDQICAVVEACTEIVEAESQDIFLFFSLGQQLEQLDWQLRLQQPIVQSLQNLDPLCQMLVTLHWGIETAWNDFKQQRSLNTLYPFTRQLQVQFEAVA